MPVFELNGQPYETDADGFLQDANQWNKGIAEYMAKGCGITLTLEHWNVIGILRNYYQEYGYPPQMKIIAREMKKMLGEEKGNAWYFHELFPQGQYNQAFKIAGISVSFSCGGCGRVLIGLNLWSNTYGNGSGIN